MISTLSIGTRGSALALYQAHLVEQLIQEANPGLETKIHIVETVGDRDRKTALSKVSEVANVQRGIFIKELEEALADGTVDIAVHSLKDMPSVLNEGFCLPVYLARAAREDVLVSKYPNGIEGLPPNATIATGGVRRQSQLKTLREDLQITEIRGNVPTRLEKVANQETVDATLLAAAGLERLEYPVGGELEINGCTLYLHKLSTVEFLPPGGQGVIAIETVNEKLNFLEPLLSPLNCTQTARECDAERQFLHHLGASCDTPVAAMAETLESGDLRMEVRYWHSDERLPKTATLMDSDPETLASDLASRVLPQ